MTRRWVCPKCEDGCLAPSRPRKDDVRRYCLECSKKTGRLVERICPAHQKEAQQRTERRQTKQKEKAAAVKEARNSYPNNLYKAAKKYARLKTWGVDLTKVAVRIRRGTSVYSSGHAYYYENRYVVTAGTHEGDAHDTIIHELAHHCCHKRGLRKEHHGARFRAFLHAAVEEVVGHRVFVNGKTRWDFRTACAEALAKHLKSKQAPLPTEQPTEVTDDDDSKV
jgi:uncharacterized Zn finger protein (UPF0148 family)